MEITTIKDFIHYYGRVRERTNRLIDVIPPENLDFSYKKGKFSIGDQIRHIATIERYLFAETIKGGKNSYMGCGKELADNYDMTIKLFNDLHLESLEIISVLSDKDLQCKCHTPGKVDIRISKWLQLMVEHEIHHRGQLYIYLNLLEVRTPPMFGLTAEELLERSARKLR